jgi:hypothetical protein
MDPSRPTYLFLTSTDPVGVLAQRKTTHAAIIDPVKVGELLRALFGGASCDAAELGRMNAHNNRDS